MNVREMTEGLGKFNDSIPVICSATNFEKYGTLEKLCFLPPYYVRKDGRTPRHLESHEEHPEEWELEYLTIRSGMSDMYAMNVGKLKAELSKYPDHTPVIYRFGSRKVQIIELKSAKWYTSSRSHIDMMDGIHYESNCCGITDDEDGEDCLVLLGKGTVNWVLFPLGPEPD